MALSRHRADGHQAQHPAAAVHQHHPEALMPLRTLSEHGLGEQMSYELISSELLLDGQARLNLATFAPPGCRRWRQG